MQLTAETPLLIIKLTREGSKINSERLKIGFDYVINKIIENYKINKEF